VGLCAFQRLPLAGMPGCAGCCYLSPTLACCHCMVPPVFGGGSTGQCMLCGCIVPLPLLHVLAWLPFLNSGLGMPCIVSLGICTLMSFKSVWYLHSCSFGLHSLHAGPCPPSHHRTHFACSRAWARGGGLLAVWCFACAALPGSRLGCMFVFQELFRRGWPRCLASGFQCFASDLCQFLFVGCAPSRA
jgi:hypothetical protein